MIALCEEQNAAELIIHRKSSSLVSNLICTSTYSNWKILCGYVWLCDTAANSVSYSRQTATYNTVQNVSGQFDFLFFFLKVMNTIIQQGFIVFIKLQCNVCFLCISSFEKYHSFCRILSSTNGFNIDNNKKRFLSVTSAYRLL